MVRIDTNVKRENHQEGGVIQDPGLVKGELFYMIIFQDHLQKQRLGFV